MSRSDAVWIASRTLAVLLTVWALTDLSYLPGAVFSYLRYASDELGSSPSVEYWRHSHLVTLGFLITRVVGYALMARWLYKGGPEVAELLLPTVIGENEADH
jgi:hypothetical protein